LSRYQRKIVFYEEDFCQNYMPDSPWHMEYTDFYKQFCDINIISTGNAVVKRHIKEGGNANFLPKGFDPNIITEQNISRDINFGFIGTFSSNVYVNRYNMLRYIARHSELQCFRATPGKEYNDSLNRINTFFSADIGIGEYMAKKF
jgi:hypothetical protein